MKQNKPQVAGYGLHYHANNQLIPNTSDRLLFQCLLDIVRKQLANSLDNQTIILSQRQLGYMSGLNVYRTVPASLERLEALGLIKRHKNGISMMCDQYVALVQYYELLNKSDKEKFAEEFSKNGIQVLENYGIVAEVQCRSELVGVSGSSISMQYCTSATYSSSEVKNIAEVQHSDQRNQEMLQKCNIEELGFNVAEVQHFSQEIAKTLHFCNTYCTFAMFSETLDVALLQHGVIEAIKVAFETGNFPKNSIFGSEKCCTSAISNVALLQLLASKVLHFCNTVIIYNNKNNNKGGNPLKNEIQTEEENENFQQNIQKSFEGFGKVEVIDLDEPSEKIKEDFMDIDDISQQKLKRAERAMRAKNSYRNKPFIKVERAKEIVDCLDEVVKSPVDFFIYQFWWGIFDLYCEHYHPSTRINEEGEIEDEPQLLDWKEMIGAALPQDEIYSIAQNVYEDMIGAIEQGKYVYGDDNEWEVSFGFTTFQDFNPYEIFQWSPCTMQDKSVPALKVAIDRFYDIEANDVFTPNKGGKVDKKTKNFQNKKLINFILSADDTSLSPMESAIKEFYRDFVVSGDDNIIDEFTDGKGTVLESGGGLPDHLLKPWCYNLSSVRYNEFTGVLCNKYKPCDGVHKKAYIFSAENVVEWNERNGYTDTIAHEALQ